MYDTIMKIYKRSTSQQKYALLQEFHTFKFEKDQDIVSNINRMISITHKLKDMEETVNNDMIITKIMSVLPGKYKHFGSV